MLVNLCAQVFTQAKNNDKNELEPFKMEVPQLEEKYWGDQEWDGKLAGYDDDRAFSRIDWYTAITTHNHHIIFKSFSSPFKYQIFGTFLFLIFLGQIFGTFFFTFMKYQI